MSTNFTGALFNIALGAAVLYFCGPSSYFFFVLAVVLVLLGVIGFVRSIYNSIVNGALKEL